MNCASCGQSIPEVVATAPFCPYCGESHEDSGGSGDPSATFSKPAAELCLAFHPQVGFALVGPYDPRGGKPCLRAYDLYNKRVAWEALAGEREVDDLDHETIAVRGRNVYVALGRVLRVLDLFTGQPKWAAELTDSLNHDGNVGPERGLRIVDPGPPDRPGAILTFSSDDFVTSLDRDTGRLVWREEAESMPERIVCVEGTGLVMMYPKLRLVNPAVQKPLVTFEDGIERWDVEGRYAILQVRHHGWRDREGILLHDLVENKEILFEAVDQLEDDVPTVMGPGRVFAATERGKKLYAGPPGKTVALVPGFDIKAMVMGGPTLFALLKKEHGTGYRRLLGIDPQTLAVRFDLGELPEDPDHSWRDQLRTNGQITVFASSPKDDRTELWGLDPGGRVLWKTGVGYWRGHYFLGGHVVAFSSDGWRILRPDTGQILASYVDR